MCDMCGMMRYQKYMAVMSSQVYELPTFEHKPMRYGDDSVPSKSFSRQAHRQAQTPVKLLLLTLCFWRCPRNDMHLMLSGSFHTKARLGGLTRLLSV